jgi:hypothetical protein
MLTTIHPEAFHQRMRERWTTTLGNVYTPKLGMQWTELASVFNQHVAAHDDPTARERYTVINAALGAGKTQGTIVYCAMLAEAFADEQQPGVLIVTRRINEANEIEAAINELAGRRFAFAYHSEVTVRAVKPSDLAQFPVLILTHRGYQLALDRMAREGTGRWPEFARFGSGDRKLNVIDEAIDLVEHDNVTVDGLEKALILIPESLRRDHAAEYQLLQETLAHLKSPEAFQLPDGRRAVLYDALKAEQAPDLSPLHSAIHFAVFKRDWGWSGEEIKERLLDTVQAVQRVFAQWSYIMKLPTGDQALHTARLILPKETKGAVVLDATAKPNILYRLFGDRVEVRTMPFHPRSYKNVHLHVSRGHRTGKGYIVKNADEAAREIMSNLARHLQGHQKTLIVTHKDAETAFVKYAPSSFLTTHWGAIDGSNEWRDADAVAIVSLPRRPDSWATSSYFAITGDVQNEFLGEKGDKMRQAIRIGQVLSDMAQAIGRTRCRKVVDEDGNCDPVDVVLFLPDTEEGAAIASGIREFFVGCGYSEFTYQGEVTKAKSRVSRIEEAFVICLRGLPKGTTTAKELRATTFRGCSRNSWTRLTETLRDTTSSLYREMVDLGIIFHPGSKGRGSGAAFVRA